MQLFAHASLHRLEAVLLLKCRYGLPARTAWKQRWCSNTTAGCQPSLLGSSFGAQMPLRAAGRHRLEAALVLALLGSRFAGCQPAPSLEAALVLKCRCWLPARTPKIKCRCRLPARTACKQLCYSNAAACCQLTPVGSRFSAQMPLRAAPRTAWKQRWCSNTAAGCPPARLGSVRAQMEPTCTAWKQVWCSNPAAGCQPALLASSFGAQIPLRAASPHRLEAALVLKCRCELPAGTVWKQLWCSHCLEVGLRAAIAHGLEAALVLKCRGGLPARTAWKQVWCSSAAAGCQPAPVRSGYAQMPLRAASSHRLQAPKSSFGAQKPLQAA